MNYFKIISLAVVFVINFKTLNSQIKVSEVLQPSKIASDTENKLYYVDFWATWCAPCIHAKKMLAVVQQQVPSELYIISLSQENTSVVERFLEKKPTALAVALDFEGNTFGTYNVLSIPHGILFDANGQKLWEGHPADLTLKRVKRFLHQVKSTSSISDFLAIQNVASATQVRYEPKTNIEVKHTKLVSDILEIEDGFDYKRYKGRLKDIISHLSEIYEGQIAIPQDLNTGYEVFIKNQLHSETDIANQLIEKLGYQVAVEEGQGEALLLTIQSPLFWDTQQIDWGDNSSEFLVSDTDLMADNVSLNAIAYQLAMILEQPVVIANNSDNHSSSLHDWQIHYKFFEFMKNNFQDYGITVSKGKATYPLYRVIKKASE